MYFIRRSYWWLYPTVGASIGAICLQHQDIQTGLIDGGLIGLSCATWYWIRRQRYNSTRTEFPIKDD